MPSPTLTVLMDGGGSDPEDVVRFDVGYIALPGYFIADTPWAGSKAQNGWSALDQGSARLGGGMLDSTGNVTASVDKDHWLPAGTLKWAAIYSKDPDAGIVTLKFGGTSQGTVDTYAAVASLNSYSEIAGIAVSAGLKNVQMAMDTKNASSSNYAGRVNTYALIRTGA